MQDRRLAGKHTGDLQGKHKRVAGERQDNEDRRLTGGNKRLTGKWQLKNRIVTGKIVEICEVMKV